MDDVSRYTAYARDLHSRCLPGPRRIRDEALNELRGKLVAAAKRKLEDPRLEHLADDCANDALETIMRKLDPKSEEDKIGGPASPDAFLSWCTTIVRNQVEQERRRLDPKSNRPNVPPLSIQDRLDSPLGDDDRTLGETVSAPAPDSPEYQVTFTQSMVELSVRSLKLVSERSRKVLFMEGHDGLVDAEIAQALGIDRDGVQRTRWHNRNSLQKGHPELVAEFRDLCSTGDQMGWT